MQKKNKKIVYDTDDYFTSIIGILYIFKFGIPSYYDYNFSIKIKKYDLPDYSIYIIYNHVSNLQLMHREPTAYDFFLHLIICLDERFL